MPEIYKKWIILAAILLLIGANSLIYFSTLSQYAIIIFFMIPSILWMDEALSKYKPNLSQLLSFLFLLTIGWLFFSRGFAAFKNSSELLAIDSLKLSFIIIHILIFIWAISYILFQNLSPRFTIPHSYNIAIYAAFMIFLLITKRGDYPYFINILLNFIILNSIYIALYYIFNLHLTHHHALTLPFYMIFLGILFTFYVHFFSPYVGGDLGRANFTNDILKYICIQIFIMLGLLMIGMESEGSKAHSSYQALSLLCMVAFLITCIARYILRTSSYVNEDALFSIFGVDILCCLVIFLFKILGITNKLLRSLLVILTIILISIKAMEALIILGNKYNILNLPPKWRSDFFLSNYFISKHALFLLTGLLIISIIYRFLYPPDKHDQVTN